MESKIGFCYIDEKFNGDTFDWCKNIQNHKNGCVLTWKNDDFSVDKYIIGNKIFELNVNASHFTVSKSYRKTF